jgi:hypothetical protein
MYSYVSPLNGLKYTFSQAPMDFVYASKACNDIGGHLAAFTDITEQQVRGPAAVAGSCKRAAAPGAAPARVDQVTCA